MLIFNCSFDFYNSILGVALYRENLKFASGLWITEQVEGSDKPSKDWTEFFIKMLAEYVIENEEGLALPIYIFVNDDSEMVICPTR
ncbi:MAG: hypothetical protein SPI59_03260 [Finegoldia sp.]|nr:hypothetical protein [Finegoldia sp.]